VIRLALLAALVLAGTVRADEIPADKRALIVLRVLAYDRNLPRRAASLVSIAVIFRPGDAASVGAASALSAALGEAARQVSVADRPVQIVTLPFRDGLDRDLVRAGVAAAYVCPGLEAEVANIATAARRSQTLTFTGEEAGVRSELSVGLVRRGDKAAILVNLVAARAEGADPSAALLRLAEVVKR
jgi:hypothetical protein